MLLVGTIAEIVIKLEPKLYRKYICKNKYYKLMLYGTLIRALNGTLKAARHGYSG